VLGSAAAEGTPALFCVCDLCREARQRGGPDIRRRAAYLFGDEVMVDFGPDAFHSMIALGLDYSPLRHLLVSHSHQDHWHPHELFWRRPGFSVIPEGSLLAVHGNSWVEAGFAATFADPGLCSLEFRPARAFQETDLGGGLSAVAVLANHAGDEEALNWIARGPAGAVLFGNDTGWYPAETWDFLAGAALDVAFLDATSGRIPCRDGHMGAAVVLEARDMLGKIGALAPSARVLANHFSHNGGMLHGDLTEFYAPHGIGVAYDGLEVGL
jgi:phosphoribosyl 1,2-cyclic phosphate phosphodiesterase